MKTAIEKKAEWESYTEGDPLPSLALGTVVRARRHLDMDGAQVVPGTLGYVFGETNCYGDGAGPIVQWITVRGNYQVEAILVCNIYPGDVVVERCHTTVITGHL